MKRNHIPAALFAATAFDTVLLTACGNANAPQTIGSADGPTEITVSDENDANIGIIGGADGPTAIYVTDGSDAPNAEAILAAKAMLTSKGLELISRMNSLARSNEYISTATSSQPILDQIQLIAAADYTSPEEIFVIDGSGFAADTTDFVRGYIREKAIRSIPSMLNALDGAQTLSAAAILQVDETFRCNAPGHTVIYLYAYRAAYSVMVTYSPGEDGTVAATASFVKFSSTEPATISHHVAEAIGSVIDSTDITVRSIDTAQQ